MNGAKVTFEDWHVWVQIIAFCIIFTSFIYFVIRTMRMKKDKEQELASMPLDPDAQDSDESSTNHSKK